MLININVIVIVIQLENCTLKHFSIKKNNFYNPFNIGEMLRIFIKWCGLSKNKKIPQKVHLLF